ncbi:MAG: hypothetical protein LC104_05395 [Bacteroidales bacterium]|nr:hypothetical protein [Bacteroidales bacterium]
MTVEPARIPPRPSVAVPAPPRSPWRLRLQPLAGYGCAVMLTCGLLFFGLRLDRADFSVPFQYEHDVLLILPFVKATVERGSHWRNERLGAPGIQELHDFPVIDHLHFGIIWLIGQVIADPVVVFNVFYLLTYPITTVITMFVFRSFGLSLPAAGVGGVLYAFQPYHYLRGEIHYFLSAYYIIPLTMMVALWICQGRLPFFRRMDTGEYRFALWNRDTLTAVLIAVATASAGAYYAFFACLLLCCAAVIGWVTGKTWRVPVAGGLMVAGIALVGLAHHIPTMVYHLQRGTNVLPTQRWPEEAEMYGLKIIQLVLPVADHNNIRFGQQTLVNLSGIRQRYASPIRPLMPYIETEFDPLGAIAALGFVGLLAYSVLPVRRVWPWAPLAGLTLCATLFGTVGGFGDLFNFFISPQVRCHNRISIYIAFLSLLAVCWLADRFFDTRTGWAARCRWPFFFLLGVFGIWDQTDYHWFPQLRTADPSYAGQGIDDIRERITQQYRKEQQFYAAVEALMPGGMVYCYPYIPYPEALPYREPGSPGTIANYDMVKGYLHTQSVRWSFGTMRGRPNDEWLRTVAERPAREMLHQVALAGFTGLLIDRRGIHPQHQSQLMREWNPILGPDSPRIVNDEIGFTVLDLRGLMPKHADGHRLSR